MILTTIAHSYTSTEHDRVGEYEMKLMDIDQEHLGIPDTVYDAEIQIPAAEFARIIRDLKELGESVKIEVSKDGVRFSSEGDIGSAAVTLKQTSGAGKDASDDEDEEQEEDDEEEEEEEESKDEDDEDVSLVSALRVHYRILAELSLTFSHPSTLLLILYRSSSRTRSLKSRPTPRRDPALPLLNPPPMATRTRMRSLPSRLTRMMRRLPRRRSRRRRARRRRRLPRRRTRPRRGRLLRRRALARRKRRPRRRTLLGKFALTCSR